MVGTRADAIRCTYCGGRGDGTLLEVDLRGVRYDYCDAACATAHRQAVELTQIGCGGCDEEALGDTGLCAEHLDGLDEERVEIAWRRAG